MANLSADQLKALRTRNQGGIKHQLSTPIENNLNTCQNCSHWTGKKCDLYTTGTACRFRAYTNSLFACCLLALNGETPKWQNEPNETGNSAITAIDYQ